MTDQHNGDNITIGDITHAQGIAIGRKAYASVQGSVNADAASLDPETVRAALKELRTALGQANLPDETVISAQTAAGNALVEGVKDDAVKPDVVLSNVQKAGEALKEANVVVEEGSSLWQSIMKLAPVLGPLVVGGAHAVAAWFGIPL